MEDAEDTTFADLAEDRERFLRFLKRRLPAEDAEDVLQSAYARPATTAARSESQERARAWSFEFCGMPPSVITAELRPGRGLTIAWLPTAQARKPRCQL